MTPDIAPVTLAEKSDLWAMFQRYAGELAPMATGKPVKGEVAYAPFDNYWLKDRHLPFWAIQGGERIGFALIRFAPEHKAMQIAEFYILPKHRRDGAGLSFARALMQRHPGPWKMRQMAVNTAAVAFWRRVAEPFGYTEEVYEDKGISRVEQTLTVV
jgi:predicted acetyltransferase